ncbi:hypothetical protein NKH18_01330 [Streptomyces sp. M10(2022)]
MSRATCHGLSDDEQLLLEDLVLLALPFVRLARSAWSWPPAPRPPLPLFGTWGVDAVADVARSREV